MAMKFSFVGTLVIPKDSAKFGFVSKTKSSKGNDLFRMNLGVKVDDNNMAFCELFDSVKDVIKTKNGDFEDIEVKWADRLDKDIIDMVTYARKNVVDISKIVDGEERKEFITGVDVIEYILEHKDDISGKKVMITGAVEKQAYKGKWYDKYKINNIYFLADDDNTKAQLNITADIYYNKDCVDMSDWNTDHIAIVDGYVQQYFSDEKKNYFVPQKFVFNASKVDFNNEKQVKMTDFRLEDININKKSYHHLMWKCKLVKGAEEVEFDVSQLTKKQRTQLELGMAKLEDFKPKNAIFGEKISEIRLLTQMLVGDFADGLVEYAKPSEFEEEIYVMPTEESLEDVMKETKETKQETSLQEEDDDDLFG